jgi:hypothetical protein
MTGDHHSGSARRATLLVRAMDTILGTHNLIDGQRWDNDWAADAYLPNSFGGDDSVVDLTALAEAVPPAAKKAPAKKEAAKATRKAAAPAAKPARKTAK